MSGVLLPYGGPSLPMFVFNGLNSLLMIEKGAGHHD